MPWRESTPVSERRELVRAARMDGANRAGLSRAFGVSRKTLYKWLHRAGEGVPALHDRSRRPQRSPWRTSPDVERAICAARAAHPAWGPRKLRYALVEAGIDAPAISTIAAVLQRHGLIPDAARRRRDWQRFEAAAPNQLWQMDFKGHIPAGAARCHPLTVLDDHSRFSVALKACTDERSGTVQRQLIETFKRYGLPDAILADNGPPCTSGGAHNYTAFSVWLIRLGITVLHGRPHHPQTQGKDERFHRTLQLEVLRARPRWASLGEIQHAFDDWRDLYNFRRPHEAVGDRPPASRYRPSDRAFPVQLPSIEYAPGDIVRSVHDRGRVKFRGRTLRVSHALIGQPIALRERDDGVFDVYFCHHRIQSLDLRDTTEEV